MHLDLAWYGACNAVITNFMATLSDPYNMQVRVQTIYSAVSDWW